MAGLEFGLIEQDNPEQSTSSYRSGKAGQIGGVKYFKSTTADTWQEVFTVTTGKTFYISEIVFASGTSGAAAFLGTGAAAAESEFIMVRLGTTPETVNVIVSCRTPIKLASDTRVSFYISDSVTSAVTIIGWEE